MIALISIVVLALLALLWWWVIHPQGERQQRSRETPLPLYTTRTPGRAVSVVVPTLARAAEPVAAAAVSTETPPAPAARPAPSPAASPVAPPDLRPPRERTAPAGPKTAPVATPTFERVFTTMPWVEPEAASALGTAERPEAAPTLASAANGRSHAEPAVADGVGLPSFRPPATEPRRSAPPLRTRAAATTSASGAVSSEEARWGPPPERDPAGTVQFLPGRLEVLQGRTMEGQEIRFVRPERSGERAVVTFGRSEGAPYRHVRLNVPTVSRLHARMALEPGADQWTLENLSSTNPVAVNGADLAAGDAPLGLADGDRIEMGEIVFVFRAR